jgi:hypothetical protein
MRHSRREQIVAAAARLFLQCPTITGRRPRREWERWLATSGKTITKIMIRGDGAPDERDLVGYTTIAASAVA